jgi:hypothetical protein
MGFSRVLTPPAPLAAEALTAAMVGIGMNFAAWRPRTASPEGSSGSMPRTRALPRHARLPPLGGLATLLRSVARDDGECRTSAESVAHDHAGNERAVAPPPRHARPGSAAAAAERGPRRAQDDRGSPLRGPANPVGHGVHQQELAERDGHADRQHH